MTAQDGLQLFVKLAEAAQRTICPKTMLASSRKGIPFVIAAVFLKEKSQLHTASDGQKFEVRGESLHASRSFNRYSAYCFRPDRQRPNRGVDASARPVGAVRTLPVRGTGGNL